MAALDRMGLLVDGSEIAIDLPDNYEHKEMPNLTRRHLPTMNLMR